MKKDICQYPQLESVLKNEPLVYLFGAGISPSLTGKRYSWWAWIQDGIQKMKDRALAEDYKEMLEANDSADNLIAVVGLVIRALKSEGSYDLWMQEAFESAEIKNYALQNTLRKMLIPQDVFATTNYDRLLEQATDLDSLSYENPDVAFQMLDRHISTHVLHIHGIYDSANGIDNIVADEAQYQAVMENQGAQFIQGILGTRTVIFVGCGKTGEDANISRFIQFAGKHLKMEKRYFFLHRDGETFPGMPDNICLISYGDAYSDLPDFLEDMVQLRLRTFIERNPIVGLSAYQPVNSRGDILQQYHYSMQMVPFCGRDAELSALKEFVDQDKEFSWWSITGQAGAGKSRLALELLRQLPTKWFGFFLNDRARERDAESFSPFSNTVVVVDYVAERERTVANIIHALRERFDRSAYQFRVILLERDNSRGSASWYGKLLQRYGRFDSEELKRMEYQNHFLNLGDLDNDAVVCLIGEICKIHGFDFDKSVHEMLCREYAQKKERLQFRPLFVQIFVEAWLENGFAVPRYDSFEDLLRMVLEKEQRRWLDSMDQNRSCCNAMIRLLLRANISGKLSTEDIPAYYQGDWNTIQTFLKERSFPGKQYDEQKYSMLASVCHSIDEERYEIEPMYPDLIKEYMFSFYADADTLPAVLNELWQNEARKFSIFITRCLTDFPQNPFYERVLQLYDVNTQDLDILMGRMNLIQKYEIDKKDDPEVLMEILDNEYTFWKSIQPHSEDVEKCDQIACVKLMGLSLVARQYRGWSYYDLSQMMEVIRELFEIPGGEVVQILKLVEGQRFASGLSSNGFTLEAEEVIRLMDAIQNEESETDGLTAYVRALNNNTELMNVLLDGNVADALCLLEEMQKKSKSVEEFRILMLSCRNILMFSSEYLKEEQIEQIMDTVHRVAVLYPEDKDIYAKVFTCRILELQYYFFHGKERSEAIQDKLKQCKLNYQLSDFDKSKEYAEAIGMAWSVEKTFLLNFIDKEKEGLTSIVAEARSILQVNPHLSEVVVTMIQAQRALHKNVLKRKIGKQDVETAFMYVEQNPESETAREAFFEMLDESEERNNRRTYLTKPLVLNAIQDARYNPLSDGGISEIAYQEELLQELLMEMKPSTPYRRSTPKVGANAPCPCGSGKKFKKCCRGNGKYD